MSVMLASRLVFSFFTGTATTGIYTLSLHDALPIFDLAVVARGTPGYSGAELANVINEAALLAARRNLKGVTRSEEHTSELQSHVNIVCRLLLEKKKTREQYG